MTSKMQLVAAKEHNEGKGVPKEAGISGPVLAKQKNE